MHGVPLSGFMNYIQNTLTWILKVRVVHFPINISAQIQQTVMGILAHWDHQLQM